MGTPSPVVPVLQRLHGMPGVQIVSAVTPPDRPRGRGRQPEPPPVKVAAADLGIPVLQPPNLRGESLQAELAAFSPDVIVVAAYGRFLPTAVLELPRYGCLNLHPSLLPRHRGPSPVATTILDGDETTGGSLMLLDEGMDTGPVIDAAEITLKGGENAGELTDALFEMGGKLLQDNLHSWVNRQIQARPQDKALATVTRKLERADGLVDWSEAAETIARKCRAFDPWPGIHTHWDGRMLKLVSVSVRQESTDLTGDAGQVMISGSSRGLRVATGDGLLSLDRVLLEGGRAVSGDDFLNGHPDIIGKIIGSQLEGPNFNAADNR